MDTDKDGKVSYDEFTAATKKRFSRLDANSDGSVDANEVKTVKAKFASHARGQRGHKHREGKDSKERSRPAKD